MTTRSQTPTWRVPEPAEIGQRLRARFESCQAWLRTPANAWLVALLVVSLIARLAALDLAPMNAEQARWLAAARLMQAPSALAAALDTVAAPGPLTALVASSLARDGDAQGALALLALLQMGALTALALAVNRHLGHGPALVATAILGASPGAIFAARTLAPGSLTLTASMLLLAMLLSAIIERNGWAWAAAALVAALALANDPGALALGLLCLGAVVVYYDRVRWAPMAVGAALAVAVALAADLGDTLLSHMAAVLAAAQEQGYVERLLAAVRHVSALVTGEGVGDQLSPTEAGPLLTHALLVRLRQGLGLFVWVALPWMAMQAVQRWGRWQEHTRRHEHTLLALWLWLPLLLGPRVDATAPGWLGAATGLVMLPGAAIAVGLLAEALAGQLRQSTMSQWRWLVPALYGLGVLTLAANLYAAQAIPRLALKHDARAGYGTPYRLWRRTAELVAQGRLMTGADQLWVQAPPEAAETARWLWPNAVMLPKNDALLLPAARPALYLQWHDAPRGRGLLERLGSQELGRVVWPTGGDAVVTELRQRNPDELLALASARVDARFDAGLYLVGYDWPADARRHAPLTLATYWTFANVSSQDRTTPVTIHLAAIAADGRQAVWSGRLALDGAYWQEGLLLRQETPIELPAGWPAGPVALYAEVHDETGEPVALLDTPGRPQEVTAYLGTVAID